MPRTDVTIYLKLNPDTAQLNAYEDRQCTSPIVETTVLTISSRANGHSNNQQNSTIGVVFVNPNNHGRVKGGIVRFTTAPSAPCPFDSPIPRADNTKEVLINPSKAEFGQSTGASNKARISSGLAVDSTYKFSIEAEWDGPAGELSYTLDPVIKIQN